MKNPEPASRKSPASKRDRSEARDLAAYRGARRAIFETKLQGKGYPFRTHFAGAKYSVLCLSRFHKEGGHNASLKYNRIRSVTYSPLTNIPQFYTLVSVKVKEGLILITNDVGKRIKELRQEKMLSQEKLALKANLDRTYVAGVENGKRNISIINLEKIIHALDTNCKDFFSKIGE